MAGQDGLGKAGYGKTGSDVPRPNLRPPRGPPASPGHTPRTVVAATASSRMTAGTAPREGHAAIPRFRMVALLADGLRYRADTGQSRS
jgi:hypothetical protein